MTNEQDKIDTALNTDKEIWREPTRRDEEMYNSGMEPHVFVTRDNKVGMNYYGKCSVMSIEDWIKLAWKDLDKKIFKE
jgi:hypothetical protein